MIIYMELLLATPSYIEIQGSSPLPSIHAPVCITVYMRVGKRLFTHIYDEGQY